MVERDVQPDVDASVTEVPVWHALDSELRHQPVEVAQVRAELFGRHGGILEPRPCLLSRFGAAGQAGAVLADARDRPCLWPG